MLAPVYLHKPILIMLPSLTVTFLITDKFSFHEGKLEAYFEVYEDLCQIKKAKNAHCLSVVDVCKKFS